jgi:hypothetical protein
VSPIAIDGRRTGWSPERSISRCAAGEAVAAVREVDRREQTIVRAGHHQRDQREIEARQAQRRQADQHADHAGDQRRASRRSGNGRLVAYESRVPVQTPTMSSATWPSEIIPTRP